MTEREETQKLFDKFIADLEPHINQCRIDHNELVITYFDPPVYEISFTIDVSKGNEQHRN